MSQVRGRLFIGLLLIVLFIAGCSSPNTEVGFDPNTGKHITNWLAVHGSAYTTYNGQCAGCHGNRLDGGISAVNCFSNAACHTTATCGTCHTQPPSGAFFPNTAGKHGGHTSLPNIIFACNDCHFNAGGGTPSHFDYIVQVTFSGTLYNAKSGTAGFNSVAKTCSKISCHGGQTTPNWVIGSLDVNSQCGACHVSGTTEFNSYFSGEHNKHVNQEDFGCAACHDTAKLATVHFNDLNTTAMTQSALTIIDAANYTGGNCTINCHGENHSGRSWL